MKEVICDKCSQLNYSVAREDSFFCCSCGSALPAAPSDDELSQPEAAVSPTRT